MYRISRQEVFCKKGFLRNFAKFTRKHLCQSLFFNKVAGVRTLELKKPTDQNFITQNLRHGKEYCISKKNKLLKQSQKKVIYEYILAFAGWWSSFWEVVGSGRYFGWWWVVVDIFWLVVGGGGYILADGGWWWIYFGW